MESLPNEIYTAAQVRAMDRHAIESGVPGYELMQRAGAAALACLERHWPAASKVTILCGAGNNAGDGYVLARLVRAAGLDAGVFALSDPARLHDDAARAFADFAAAGGRPAAFEASALAGSNVVVDALLGTGVDRPVAGSLGECIAAVNAAGRPVLALDLPSGLDADTGRVQGVAVKATRTITFVALKTGLYLGAAPDHVGHLEFAGLGIPDAARTAQAPVLRRIDSGRVAAALPPLSRSAHKGDRGRVLIVGGLAMAGAARLAGDAALRTGAGLVSVATSEDSAAVIVAGRPELIGRALRSVRDLLPLLSSADAVAIGPGLGTGRRARALFDATTAGEYPLVVDADALNLLAEQPMLRENWILTPHPGEAARLLGTDVAAVQGDRLQAAKAIAERFGGVCVLKGAGTLVQSDTAAAWICDRGNPGMATAGSGDVLTGVIAALVAGGGEAAACAAAAVLLHAEAGDRAARAGERGMIAGDLVAELRAVVNSSWN
jgi:hydroxyethylthiazole kinase-like uncharacterized protein yjeF